MNPSDLEEQIKKADYPIFSYESLNLDYKINKAEEEIKVKTNFEKTQKKKWGVLIDKEIWDIYKENRKSIDEKIKEFLKYNFENKVMSFDDSSSKIQIGQVMLGTGQDIKLYNKSLPGVIEIKSYDATVKDILKIVKRFVELTKQYALSMDATRTYQD